jgi:hypothetical protein
MFTVIELVPVSEDRPATSALVASPAVIVTFTPPAGAAEESSTRKLFCRFWPTVGLLITIVAPPEGATVTAAVVAPKLMLAFEPEA